MDKDNDNDVVAGMTRWLQGWPNIRMEQCEISGACYPGRRESEWAETKAGTRARTRQKE